MSQHVRKRVSKRPTGDSYKSSHQIEAHEDSVLGNLRDSANDFLVENITSGGQQQRLQQPHDPSVCYDDCTLEPIFNSDIVAKKKLKLDRLVPSHAAINPLTKKKNDLIKFKRQFLHNVDDDLQAERQRSFLVNMDNLPQPDQQWSYKNSIQRRKPLRSLDNTLKSSKQIAKNDSMANSSISKRSSVVVPNRMHLTYEHKILIEDTQVTGRGGSRTTSQAHADRIKFPKPSSLTVTGEQKKSPTVRKTTSVNVRGLTLGSIDPGINQFRAKPVAVEDSSHNVGAYTAPREARTTKGGLRVIRRELKNMLKQSSMKISSYNVVAQANYTTTDEGAAATNTDYDEQAY